MLVLHVNPQDVASRITSAGILQDAGPVVGRRLQPGGLAKTFQMNLTHVVQLAKDPESGNPADAPVLVVL